jgi:cell division protease FtsH
MGPLSYDENEDEVFLGRSVTQHKHISDETHSQMDKEVRRIIDHAYERAKDILQTHMDKLHLMAEALMRFETIDVKQIDQIMDGKEPDPPEGWDDDSPSPDAGDDAGGEEPSGQPATG